MAVNPETPESVDIADGATDVFPTGWTFETADEVVMSVEIDGVATLQEQGEDYTVGAGDWLTDGADLTYLPGKRPPGGARVIRRRRTARRQDEPFGDQERFRPLQNEAAFDRLTRQAQDMSAQLDRSVEVPVGEAGFELARAAARAGTLLVFNDEGAPRSDVTHGQLAADAAALVTAPALSQIDAARGVAVAAVATQQGLSVTAVQNQQTTSVNAVAAAGTAATDAITALATAKLTLITAEGGTQVTLVTNTGTAQVALLNAAGATQKADILTTVPSQGPYAYAHASALPRGITGVTSLVGGSGGTNGTFALGVSGGSFTGVVGEFTVAGGAVTGVVFTNGGINLTGGTTVPTLSFAASAGLTGASATAVASPKVATQATYLAASSDGKALMLWRNDGTSTPAAVLDANGLQVGYISKSGLDAMFDQTVVTESGWHLPFTDVNGLVLGGFDADGYLRVVQAILPALKTFTDDDLTTPLGSRVIPAGAGVTFVRAYDESGYALAVTDANDLVVWGVSNLPLPKYPRVTVLGDSLSHQGQETQQRVLADRQVTALGAGGRTSTELVAMGGGVPALLTASGNTIQASGATTVSASSVSIITNQGAQTIAGTWGGVAGTLTATGFDGNGRATGFSFARTTAGQALTIPANTPFLPDLARDRQQDVWIIDIGRNDGAAAFASGATEANIEAQVKFIGHDRFLIRAVTDRGIAYEAAGSSDYAALMGMLNRLQARFGPRFVDLHRGMVDRGLTIAGLTATADDNTDIAADVIPRQLKLSEGGGTIFTHFTAAGYYARAVLTKEAIDRMGW